MTQAPATHSPRPRALPRPLKREMGVPAAAMWAFPLLMLATIAGVLAVGVPVSYLSAALVAGCVIYHSLRAKWLVATGFYFTYAALEGLYKYTTEFSTTIYYIKPFLVVVMAFLWWLSLKIDGRRLNYPPLTGTLTVMACVGFVQAFHPLGSGLFLSLATMFLWYLAPAFFYFLICNELKTPLQARQIFVWVLVIATVVSFFAAFQYGMGQKWVEGHLPGYARVAIGSSQWWMRDEVGEIISSFRPASTMAYTGMAASWSFAGIMLACSYLLEVPHQGKRLLMMLILMINAVGLLVTAVRLFVIISIICIALMLLLTARSKAQLFRNLLILALFSGIAGAGFWVSEVFSGGILQRRYAETLANPLGKLQKDRGKNFTFLPMFVPRYPLGIGFQRGSGFRDGPGATKASDFVADDSMYSNRETQFNAITADLGVAGLLLFCALMAGVLSRAYKTQRDLKSPAAQQLAAVTFAILVGYTIACLGGPSIQGSEIFYLLAALATVMPALPALSWQDPAISKAKNEKSRANPAPQLAS